MRLSPERRRRLRALAPVAEAYGCCVLTVDLLWQEAHGMVSATVPEARPGRRGGVPARRMDGEAEMDLRWAL